MDQLIEFVGNHLGLVVGFIIVSMLLAQNLLAGNKGQIDPLTATKMMNHNDAVVLDVRPMADFNKGHIINSINIPINGLKNQLSQLDKYKDKPIIVACRSGTQSGHASKMLQKAGFTQVHNLKGGILGWEGANLPISRKSSGKGKKSKTRNS